MGNDHESVDFSAKSYQRSQDALVPRSLCWKNISVWCKRKITSGLFRKTRYKDVQLLRDVSGFATAGDLVAVMGPSGGGKTTLLATISCRLTAGIKGEIIVDGDVVSRAEMVAMSGFVPQTDLAVESLTVYEHLYFMAVMKMDKSTNESKRLEKIFSLVSQFGLEKSTSTYMKNLSGGERRRLSIAVEMITDPHILFCDEPTTGLDSSNASIVVNILKKFSTEGKIVICSIHQPASGVYELFDHVSLLATEGRITYFGPVQGAVKYFESLDLKCPPSYNVAEFLINVVSSKALEDRGRVESLCHSYASSYRANAVHDNIHLSCQQTGEYRKSINLRNDIMCRKRVGLIKQTFYLLWRIIKNLRSDYINSLTMLAAITYLVLLSSIIYANVLHHEKSKFQNIQGFISVLVNEFTFGFTMFVTYVFPLERPLILRETGSRLYTVEAYYLSRVIFESLQNAVICLVFILIAKNISDIFDFVSYIDLFVIFYLFAMSSVALGFLWSSIFDDINLLCLVTSTFLNATNVFCGAYSKLSSLPGYLNWIKYLSLFYYGLQAITTLEWESVDLDEMRRFNISVDDPRAFRNLRIVADYGFTVMDFSHNLYILLALVFIFHLIAYLVISRRSKEQAVY